MQNPSIQVAKAQIADHLALWLIAGGWLSAITFYILSNRLAVALMS